MPVSCFAENSNDSHWILQHNMQKELEYMCNTMGVKSPVYTNDEVRVRKGIPYVRYRVSIEAKGQSEEPLMCYGRFARQSNDAKEDAAVVAMRRLLSVTGWKIRDYNYYNVKELEHKIQVLESEKFMVPNPNMNEEDGIPCPSSK
jgi:hypothetical protein